MTKDFKLSIPRKTSLVVLLITVFFYEMISIFFLANRTLELTQEQLYHIVLNDL